MSPPVAAIADYDLVIPSQSPAPGSVLDMPSQSPTPGSVLVMAKAPIAGRVKTRLAPLLGAQGCAALHKRLLARAVQIAVSITPGSSFVAVEPWDERALVEPLVGSTASFIPQEGDQLGERMSNASRRIFDVRPDPLVIIGTDVPTLTPSLVGEALWKLQDGCDCVFGPAHDGGYYLVGLARRTPALFSIDPALWGGPEVLRASLDMARLHGLTVGFLPPLSDLDTEADAETLADDPALPCDVAGILQWALARRAVAVP